MSILSKTFFALLTAVFFCQSAAANPIFQITEIWVGLPGPDGTEDWIEVTNFGTTSGDTGDLFYDDESLSVTESLGLDSFILGPGESAIFLQDEDPAAITEFIGIWGSGTNIGLTNGGGGLSQGGDTAALLVDAASVDGIVINSVSYPAVPDNTLATIEIAEDGTIGLSVLGVDGAYESNSFITDNPDVVDPAVPTPITLVGSPALNGIPEPSTFAIALLSVVGLAARRRP